MIGIEINDGVIFELEEVRVRRGDSINKSGLPKQLIIDTLKEYILSIKGTGGVMQIEVRDELVKELEKIVICARKNGTLTKLSVQDLVEEAVKMYVQESKDFNEYAEAYAKEHEEELQQEEI